MARPMNGKTKVDVYKRIFEIQTLEREMAEMKAEYKKKSVELKKLQKAEEAYQKRINKVLK